MKNQYVITLERELDRLWVGKSQVCVVKLGKDKFLLADDKNGVKAKGYQILRVTKRLPDRAGLDKFWTSIKRNLVTCK